MNSTNPHAVFVVGADIGTRMAWTWQWLDEVKPRHALLARSDVDPVIAEFKAEMPNHSRVAGPRLSNPECELELSRRLAESILPEQLRDEIKNRCSEASTGLFKIIPPPSAYAIPWVLLPFAGDKRIVEVMDVVQVAPPLSRDGSEERPQTWNPAGDEALRVIDPLTVDADTAEPRWVLFAIADRVFDAKMYGWSETDGCSIDDFRPALRACDLSERLKAKSYSHWLWVGHVETKDVLQGSELVLTDCNLSAAQLFLGSRDSWPMPGRVGLVACESGADLKHAEPFGLVVAMLEAGAELVIATQWTLPTDKAFVIHAGITTVSEFTNLKKKPFNDAAHTVDQVLRDPDPVHALCEWQRGQLEQWRDTGDFFDSPVVWASLTNFHAPYRTVKVGQPTPGSG